jgi:uncharacterized membrane protein
MKTFGKLLSFMGVALTTVGLILIVLSSLNVVELGNNYSYAGKVTFNSEAEYSQFKTILSDSRIYYTLDQISVLSSDPPIVASFHGIIVPKDILFPYGNKTGGTGIPAALVISGFFLLFNGGMIYITQDIKQEEKES